MTTYKCIKPACDNSYESNDTEAYYCPSCVEVNKALAKQIDAKIASRPTKNTKSAWKEYEEAAKMSVGGLTGVHIKI